MMLTGCGMSGQQTEQNGGKEQNKVENEKISVVATIFPQYDFVRQIAGENVELKMLLKKCNYLKKPRKRQGNHRMGKNTCELWISSYIRSAQR